MFLLVVSNLDKNVELFLTSCLSREIIETTSHVNPQTEASLSPPTGERQDKLSIEMVKNWETLEA